MAYCTGKTIEMARGNAMKMLFMERKPVCSKTQAVYFSTSRTEILGQVL